MGILDAAHRRFGFTLGDLCLLPLAVFLFSLPFSHTVALRLYTLLIALVVALVYTARGRGPPSIPLKLPLALWAGVALASLAWSAMPGYSLREIRNEIGYSLIAFLVCYTMAANERAWRLYVVALVASFLAVSAVGLHWFAMGYDQITDAPHGGVGHYSTYLVTILPLLMIVTLDAARHGFPASILRPLLPLLLLVDGYGTANRAFWPAVIVSTVVFAFLYALRAAHFRVRMKVLTVATMVVILAATAFGVILQQRATQRSDTVAEALATDPRLPLWPQVFTMIERHPVIGGGFGRGIYGKELSELNGTPELWHGHNMFLNYALQLGIVGVLVLVILLVAITREFWRLYRADDPAASMIGLAGITMLAGFIAKNATDDFFVRQNSLMFWSVVGLSLGYGRWRMRSAASEAPQGTPRRDGTSA